ncbi:MAG: hypothetical protein V4537_00135 [Pseudomonadota bacterium]
MFGTSKPTASLSSGLLARKGQARPAMRPQGFHGQDFTGASMNLDDLGWNDMGDEPVTPAAVVAIAPAAAPIAPPVAFVPPVLVERESLREEIEAEPVVEAAPIADTVVPVPPAAIKRIGREVRTATAKAAFTLRLDADRHLRLRLASASRNLSSQTLVVAALDAFLASLPEVEGLVSQLSTDRTSRGK